MTEKRSLVISQKAEIVKSIKEEVVNIKSTYDLVRVPDPIISSDENKFIIAEMILELNEMSNVSRKMNEAQIVETVNMLLDEYPRLSLQEYQVFFNRIKSGKFGQLYDSLDGIKIMVFMKDFYEEVNNAYYDFKEEKHQDIKRIEGHRDI